MKRNLIERGRIALIAGAAVTAVCLAAVLPAGRALAAGGEGKVLAVVGNHKITQKDLDASVKPQLEELHKQFEEVLSRKTEQIKSSALNQMIDKYLVDQAAKQAKLTPDAYLKKEIDDKIGTVSDADAKKLYDAHKAQIPGSFEQTKAQIIAFLRRQKEGELREKLFEDLRAKQNVRVTAVGPRTEVASAGHPVRGPANAPVTIVEFGDFQCPYCRASEPTLKDLRNRYGDKIRLVYMDFPLSMHQHALDAAKAGRCAEVQGKFWEYHDELFANQTKLSPDDLKGYAKKLGLNTKQFDTCFNDAKYESAVRADMHEGDKLGVTGTPTFFIDGRELSGAQPPSAFENIINDELAGADHEKSASAK